MYQELKQHKTDSLTFTYANPNEYNAGAERSPLFNPFDAKMTSPEDLKNLPKAMANIDKAMGGSGGFPTDSSTFKINVREYEGMSIKVGDKVTIEIKKADTSGI